MCERDQELHNKYKKEVCLTLSGSVCKSSESQTNYLPCCAKGIALTGKNHDGAPLCLHPNKEEEHLLPSRALPEVVAIVCLCLLARS